MDNFFNTLKEIWHFLVIVGTAVGGAITYWRNLRKNQQESSDLVYKQLEKTKLALLEQFQIETSLSKKINEQQRFIDYVKINCPKCHNSFFEK